MNAPDPRIPRGPRGSAPESERMLVGQLLLDPTLLASLRGQLDPSHFSVSRYRVLYGVMVGFSERGRPFDPVLVAEAARREGVEVEADALFQLIERAVATATADEHVAQIREAHERRQLHASLQSASEQLADPGSTPAETLAAIRQSFDELSTSLQSDAPRVYYFGDPAHEPDLTPPKAYVEGLLREGFTCQSGPPKIARKTLFDLALAFSIQAGVPFLGRPTRRARVGWLQRDMAQPAFHEYASKVRSGLEIPAVSIPYICDPIDLMKPEGRITVEQFCEHEQVEILFIDSARAVSSVRESESDDVRIVVRETICERLRDRLGVSVVLICHTPKQGTGARGSGEWEAGADSLMRFQPAGDGAERKVTVTGEGRHPSFRLAFRLNDLDDDGIGIVECADESAAQSSRSWGPPLAAVRDIVRENSGGLSATQLIARLRKQGFAISNDRRAELLSELVEKYPQIRQFEGSRRARILQWQDHPTDPASDDSDDEDST